MAVTRHAVIMYFQFSVRDCFSATFAHPHPHCALAGFSQVHFHFQSKRNVTFLGDRLYQTVVCLSCLSVTFVHCGKTVGRIKMKLGTQVGLGPGHIMLEGDPAPSPKGAQPPIFSPYLLWPNAGLDGLRCDLVWS